MKVFAKDKDGNMKEYSVKLSKELGAYTGKCDEYPHMVRGKNLVELANTLVSRINEDAS